MARARNDEVILAFADVLKSARKAAGLSQEALAFQCEIDRTFVGLLESGKRQPTISVLFAIALELGIEPEEFVAEVRRRSLNP